MQGHSFLGSILTLTYGAHICVSCSIVCLCFFHIIDYFWTISYAKSQLQLRIKLMKIKNMINNVDNILKEHQGDVSDQAWAIISSLLLECNRGKNMPIACGDVFWHLFRCFVCILSQNKSTMAVLATQQPVVMPLHGQDSAHSELILAQLFLALLPIVCQTDLSELLHARAQWLQVTQACCTD